MGGRPAARADEAACACRLVCVCRRPTCTSPLPLGPVRGTGAERDAALQGVGGGGGRQGGARLRCGGRWRRARCAPRGGSCQTRQRRPPLLPSAFAAELEKKSFTNGKDDKPLVKRLYEAAFEEQFGKATELDYGSLGWGDAEAAQLAEVLASGAAPRLEKLYLQRNKIGDEGCKALAAALKEGAAPSLKARDPRHTRTSPAQCSSRLSSRADAQGGQQGAA